MTYAELYGLHVYYQTQLERKAYLAEYDPKYCQVIMDRMLALDNDLKIRKNGKPYKAKTTIKQ